MAQIQNKNEEYRYKKLNPNINYYREITGRFKFIKKIIRKLCSFLLEPAFREITEFNKEVTRELKELQSTHKFLLEQNEYLKKNK